MKYDPHGGAGEAKEVAFLVVESAELQCSNVSLPHSLASRIGRMRNLRRWSIFHLFAVGDGYSGPILHNFHSTKLDF